ncbi:MAG: BMC domain-containing protein [Planctomycetales bacterium]|nr:BMC domain-containing protein [Planctomycetales bacterium]NIM09457.1 BMC domain-containing protein [Planctomycetales bacterium]NIN08945.1 BMC domain-containing protein [Planctomycetales bacterium]NIN78060.1 BMC domain-containing protein [Planctomycetales bacterium]NIO35238.1 BMC domain-containing protein [Planctomycetales bacterium]
MKNGSAIGIVETSSIAKGFEIADSMLKTANVRMVVNRTICPGKYMVLVGGEVDAVNSGVEVGLEVGAHTVVDSFVIPNLHPAVFPAISGVSHLPKLKSLGVIEAFSVASVIEAADAAVKATQVQLITINLAMAIGGKGWVSMTGDVASVAEAVEVGAAVIERKGLLVEKVVIPAPRPEIVAEFI